MEAVEQVQQPTIREIQYAVSHEFGVTPLDLVSDRRSAVVARPRQVAMWIAKHTTTMSLPAIGRHFGGRDHTTVMHAIARIEQLMSSNADLADAVGRLLRTVDCVESVEKRRAAMRLVA